MNDKQDLANEAQQLAQHLEDCRTKGRLRAELWARAYAAEFAGLRSGGLRDHQEADAARRVAYSVADAVAEHFDQYCREHHL